jgi:hypothetical protein
MKLDPLVLLAVALPCAFAGPANGLRERQTTLTCGVVGYDTTAAYYYDGSGANGNFAACSALCNADSNCESFGFGSGDCLLYSVTVYV